MFQSISAFPDLGNKRDQDVKMYIGTEITRKALVWSEISHQLLLKNELKDSTNIWSYEKMKLSHFSKHWQIQVVICLSNIL